jgi:hypothetical protein
MIELGYELGCDGVNFEPLMIWSKEGEKLKLNEEQMRELKFHIERALKKARELGIYSNIGEWKEKKFVIKKDMREILKEGLNPDGKNLLNSPCFLPWLNMEIRVSGRVTACRVCNDETGCENILDKSLKEIWLGKYFTNLREEFLRGNLPNYCKDCASGLIIRMKNLRNALTRKVRNRFPREEI